MTRIAVLQMCSGIDPLLNAYTISTAAKHAAADGAAMLFSPEMSGLLDRDRKRAAGSICRLIDDPVFQSAQQAASQNDIWISVGSLAVLGDGGDERFSNRSLVIDNKGSLRDYYDKIHLFDVDVAKGESWRESAAYAPGARSVVAMTPVGRMGLSVCYDLRFPALYQQLSAAGAEILSIPAAFTVPTGTAHWHVLMRARAIENACWVIAAAQSGHHGDGRTTFGHSLVVDPWGEVILDMGEGEGLGFAEIELDRVSEARTRIPVIAHRLDIPVIRPIIRPAAKTAP